MIKAIRINRPFLFLALTLLVSSISAYGQKGRKSAAAEERKRIAFEKNFIEGQKYFMLDDYAKALVYFTKAQEYDKENATLYYKIGEIHLKNEALKDAEENALEALQRSKENKYFYLLLGQIYNKQSRFVESAKLYEEMIATIPAAKEYLFDLASIYLFAKNYEKAIVTYQRAEEVYGNLPEIAYAKQKVYLKQNNMDKAIEEGKALTEIYPGEGTYLLNLANILLSNGDYDEAITYLNKIAPGDVSYPNSRVLLSGIHEKQGNQDESINNLQSAIEAADLPIERKLQLLAEYINKLPDPEIVPTVRKLVTSLAETHPDEANAHIIFGDFLLKIGEKSASVDKYLKALDLDNSNFNVWLNVLQIEWELNRLEALAKHSEEALEIFPNQAIIYYYNGTSKVYRKEYEAAAEILEHGKRLARKDENLKGAFNGQLGEAYSALKEYEKSDAAFDEALAQDPNNFVILNNYSYYLAIRKDKLDVAKRMSTKLIRENPEDGTFLDTHAWVLYMLKEYKDARIHLEKAIKLGNPSGTILEHYGDVLFKLGEKDKAIEQWEKAKGLDGKSEFIDRKIADRKLYE